MKELSEAERRFWEDMRRCKLGEVAAIEELLGTPQHKRVAIFLKQMRHYPGAKQEPIGDNRETSRPE